MTKCGERRCEYNLGFGVCEIVHPDIRWVFDGHRFICRTKRIIKS